MTVVMRIAQRCADAGIRVVRAQGCERRGNGQSWPQPVKGIANHHTGGGNNIYLDRNLITGRTDLPGPLTNFATLYDGDLAVVAAHPANHAGASGGWDTAPLPVTRTFNREVIGNEVQYRGTEPMSPAQWRTLLVFNRIALDELGFPGQWNRVKFHQGTSVTGKWDCGYGPGKTYDIHAFRRELAAQEDEMADPRVVKLIEEIHHEATLRLPSRSARFRDSKDKPSDTVLGWALNGDARADEALAELRELRAQLPELIQREVAAALKSLQK